MATNKHPCSALTGSGSEAKGSFHTAAAPTQKSTNVRPTAQTKTVWKTHAQHVSSRDDRDNKRPREDT